MKTEETQGSFITLIRMLVTKAEQARKLEADTDTVPVSETDSVPVYPRAAVVAKLLVLRALSKKIQDRLAEEDRYCERVFRYSTPNPSASSFASSSLRRALK